MTYKNTKGEVFFVFLVAIAGIILAILALGLVTGENRFLGTFLGQYGGSDNDQEECGFVLDTPEEGEVFVFPYTVSGKINGCGWTAHEGEIGWIEIIDETGATSAQEPIAATSPWMAQEVFFNQNLNFPLLDGDTATLRFHNTDASGENPLSVDIHVVLQ